MPRPRTIAVSLVLVALLIGCGELATGIAEPDPDQVRKLVEQARLASPVTIVAPALPALRSHDELVTAYPEWALDQTVQDALGRIGAAAVPQLIELLSGGDPVVRARAAKMLARIGPDSVTAVTALIQALSDDDPSVRKAAARALGQIGPDAAAAVPALIDLMHPGDVHPAP